MAPRRWWAIHFRSSRLRSSLVWRAPESPRRRSRNTVAALALPLAALLVAAPVMAQEPATQEPATGPPQTRAEAIADERSAKVAELWPQRQSPMVDRMNALVERGLQEGLASGRGANGAQLIFGGMRSGQGFSGGIGYRRSDLWQERLGYRVTARATPSMAHMLDLDLDFQGLRTEKTSLRWYTKYEHSPNIDYYGFGNESSKENLTGYLYDDFTTDFSAAWEPVRFLRLGLTGGYLFAHTEEGSEELPPIGEVFPPNQLPGYGEDTQYTRIGLFAYVDSRDAPAGPRSGLLLGARYREVLGRGSENVRLPPIRVRVPAVLSLLQPQSCRCPACCGHPLVPQGRQRRAVVSAAVARRQRRPAWLRAVSLSRFTLPVSRRRTSLAPLEHPRHGGVRRRLARSCRSNARSTSTRSTTAAASASGSGWVRRWSPE